jgi:hypothetical protein
LPTYVAIAAGESADPNGIPFPVPATVAASCSHSATTSTGPSTPSPVAALRAIAGAAAGRCRSAGPTVSA